MSPGVCIDIAHVFSKTRELRSSSFATQVEVFRFTSGLERMGAGSS